MRRIQPWKISPAGSGRQSAILGALPITAHPECFVPLLSQGEQSLTHSMIINSAGVVKYRDRQ